MNNIFNKNYAIDNVAVSNVSTPIGTSWKEGTRITNTTTGSIYILKSPNNPGDTISTLISLTPKP